MDLRASAFGMMSHAFPQRFLSKALQSRLQELLSTSWRITESQNGLGWKGP